VVILIFVNNYIIYLLVVGSVCAFQQLQYGGKWLSVLCLWIHFTSSVHILCVFLISREVPRPTLHVPLVGFMWSHYTMLSLS